MNEPNPDKGLWPVSGLSDQWAWEPFNRCFIDATSRKKLPQKDYLSEGKLAVVDQGERLIGGFTNDETLAYRDGLPVIVWGDHTKVIKFVDFPFAQGADGVKVLRPNEEVFDPHFAYEALKTIDLPDKGYSRHFKFLKASLFPVPPIHEQRRIVAKLHSLFKHSNAARKDLSRISGLVERYKQGMLAAAFRGDLTAGWRAEKRLAGLMPATLETIVEIPIRNGLSVRGSDSPPGVRSLRLSALRTHIVDLNDVRFLPISDAQAAKFALLDSDVLVSRGNGTKAFVGLGAIVSGIKEQTIFPDTAFRIRLDPEKAKPKWLATIWNSPQVRSQIEYMAKTTAGIWKISQSDLARIEFLLPSPAEQDEIVRWIDERLEQITQIATESAGAARLLERLEQATLRKAFRGELL